MNHDISWADHHGPEAVQQLIDAHPNACPDAIRQTASRWHASENLPGFLKACDQAIANA